MNLPDIRDEIFQSAAHHRVTAAIIADDEGIVAEIAAVRQAAHDLELHLDYLHGEGRPVNQGDEIARLYGTPKQVVMAEDRLIGLLAKPSGIATAARRFVDRAGNRPEIVSGAWKKMPGSLKETIRRAIATGGAKVRISPAPFLYLDKNYVRMLGGVKSTLQAVAGLNGYLRVIQLKGDTQDLAREASEAVTHGAGVLFIDSGDWGDIEVVTRGLRQGGLRERVKIAFGGNIQLNDIDTLRTLDVDILDVGRQIVDAPLLDMRLEVLDVGTKE